MVSIVQGSLLSDSDVNDQYNRLNNLLDGFITSASVPADKNFTEDPTKSTFSNSNTQTATLSGASALPTNNIQPRNKVPFPEQFNLLQVKTEKANVSTSAPQKSSDLKADLDLVRQELDRFYNICFESPEAQKKVKGLDLTIKVEDSTELAGTTDQDQKLRAATERVNYPILVVESPNKASNNRLGEDANGIRKMNSLKHKNLHSASVASLSGALSQRALLSTRNRPRELDSALLEQQYSYIKERSQSTRHARGLEGATQSYFRKDLARRQVHASPRKLGANYDLTNLVEQNVLKFERELLLMKRGELEALENEHQLDRSVCIDYLDVAQSRQPTDRGDVKEDRLTVSPSKSDLNKSKNLLENGLSISPLKEPVTYQIVVEEYENGSFYEGEKYLEKRHGKGTLVYGENFKYKGEWINDLMQGYGSLWKNDRLIYEGEWSRGSFHGKGTMFNHETSRAEEFDGSDFMKLKGAWDRFDGNFLKGMKNGIGTIIFKNGDTFCGTFRNDVVHGCGSFSKNGVTKVGSWIRNKLETWL